MDHQCKYKETDRTGLYIMVFCIFWGIGTTPFKTMHKSIMDELVQIRKELAELKELNRVSEFKSLQDGL